ncbi:hypothetical protein AB3S75_044195 [Citrus x aurantiifolia]
MATHDRQAAVISYEAPRSTSRVNYFPIDASLRFLLFSACLVSVIVMVTSKQTERAPVSGVLPFLTLRVLAKFNYSPAFIYFVAALSVAGLYSIIAMLASIYAIKNPSRKVLLMLAFWDVVMLGVVASATAASGAVAYIGLKGNDHIGWRKMCNVFDKFCRHIASATAVSLVAAILLVLLSMLSTYSLYKRIHD